MDELDEIDRRIWRQLQGKSISDEEFTHQLVLSGGKAVSGRKIDRMDIAIVNTRQHANRV